MPPQLKPKRWAWAWIEALAHRAGSRSGARSSARKLLAFPVWMIVLFDTASAEIFTGA
jgi:hypothetical protein